MKFTYEKISDDAYAVFDGDKQHCAVFNYVDTPDHNLPTGVHLDISITPSLEVEKLFLGGATAKEIDYLAGIFSFVLNTVLKFADDKGLALCLIYSSDRWNSLAYSGLAKRLNPKQYDVKIFGVGRWIEIWLKNHKRSGKKS